jgi:hypothetical protein
MVAAVLGLMAQETAARRERTEASRPHHNAQPRHHHRHVTRPATGIVVVPTLVPRYYTYPPFWYPGYAPLYAAPAPMSGPNFATDASGYAYFCPDSRRYYPEVRECPTGWLAVVPGVAGPPN